MYKKYTLIFLVVLVAAVLFVGCGKTEDESVKNAVITLVDGTAGVNGKEDYPMLFDLDVGTKWCVTNFEGAHVIWSLSEPVRVTGYTIVTGNDNANHSGRNPGTWALFGAEGKKVPNENSKKWELIDYVDADTQLKDQNFTPYHYDVNDLKEKYQHFKLVILKTQSSDVMQISEFALEYNGADYQFTNSKSGEDFGEISAMAGSTYVSDGGEYTIGVGEALSLYYSRMPISAYYAYWWNIEDGDSDCLTMDHDGPTCQIVGVEPGTVTMKVTMQCSVVSVVGGGYTYDYSYTFKVNVIEGSTGYHGDVTKGLCPRCHGSKIIGCMACYGDGKLENGKTCRSCDDGYVPCTSCRGKGRWLQP